MTTSTSTADNRLVAALRSPWPRLAVFVLLLAACGWFAVTRGAAAVADARTAAATLGALGAVAFLLVYAVASMALLPASVLAAAAGVLFGPVLGATVVWTGAVLGAAGSFALGRALSRDAVRQLAGGRTDRLNAFLAARGTVAVVLVRLIPVFPFAVVNYGSAVTEIGARQYLVGTAIGIVPAVIAYATLGGHLTDPRSPAFLLSVGALGVLAVGGLLTARRLTR